MYGLKHSVRHLGLRKKDNLMMMSEVNTTIGTDFFTGDKKGNESFEFDSTWKEMVLKELF